MTGTIPSPLDDVRKMDKIDLVLRLEDLTPIETLPDGMEWIFHAGTGGAYGLYKWNARAIDFTGIPPELFGQFWTCSLPLAVGYQRQHPTFRIFEMSRWEVRGLVEEGMITLYSWVNELDVPFTERPDGSRVQADRRPVEYVILPRYDLVGRWMPQEHAEWTFFTVRHVIPEEALSIFNVNYMKKQEEDEDGD